MQLSLVWCGPVYDFPNKVLDGLSPGKKVVGTGGMAIEVDIPRPFDISPGILVIA